MQKQGGEYYKVNLELRAYWKAKESFSVGEGLLLFNSRIVVPSAMHREVLSKIHQGHQGIERCLLRARCSVWWPGITHHIKQLIQGCPVCARNTQPWKEPLIPTTLPAFPWHTVATDLFALHSTSYLLVIDYFSRFPEIY